MENQDKLLTFHEKLENFVENNLKAIFIGIGIFFLIGLLWLGIGYYNERKERKATLQLIYAENSNNQLEALKSLVENYPHTQAGLEAALLLWNYYYQNGDYSKMEKLYSIIEDDYPSELKATLLYAKAKLLEHDGKLKEALEKLKEATDAQPEIGIIAYTDIARLYERLGNLKSALAYYKRALSVPELEESGFIKYEIWRLSSKLKTHN